MLLTSPPSSLLLRRSAVASLPFSSRHSCCSTRRACPISSPRKVTTTIATAAAAASTSPLPSHDGTRQQWRSWHRRRHRPRHPQTGARTFTAAGASSSTSSSSPPPDGVDYDADPLLPPPTDGSLHRLGLPILVRAAHHASEGRVLCYDAYVHHHDHTRRPVSDRGKDGGASSRSGNDDDGGGRSGGSHRAGPKRKRERRIEYTYGEVLATSSLIHKYLVTHRALSAPLDVDPARYQTKSDPNDSAAPPRVAFLCHPGPTYIACQWAAWSSGSIAVPLCTVHRRAELKYVLEDCTPEVIIDGVSGIGGGGGTAQDDPSGQGRELRAAAEEAGVSERLVRVGDILAWCDDARSSKKAEERSRKKDDSELPLSLPPRYELGSGGLVPSLRSPATLLFTSGTTGRPKGVVATHLNLYHQITDLVRAWRWTSRDSILHVLPLHHVHGIVNKLCCAVWVGASVEFMRFHPARMWERLGVKHDPTAATAGADKSQADPSEDGSEEAAEVARRKSPTLLMAVPTVYAKMLEVLPTMPPSTLPNALSSTLSSTIRLTVSGSAALPTSIFERWKESTGHAMLERYGMTEFGMALSNPYEPEGGRLPGYVGLPLPSVEVKIVDEDTGEVIPNASAERDAGDRDRSSGSDDGSKRDDGNGDGPRTFLGRSGELCVRGPTVFPEYWNRPHATAECFDFDGYFKTGDVAEYDPEFDSYHILGRVSADIIKSGGHKLSSLQIERVLLEHPRLEEAVVLGVPDETYGERVGLVCRVKDREQEQEEGSESTSITLEELRGWCKERMAPYKVPTRLVVLRDDVPKNAMGKVSKKQLVHLFEEEQEEKR